MHSTDIVGDSKIVSNMERVIMEKIFADFIAKIEKVKNGANDIFIVNAGTMNHGKSSLFNSLLDNDEFAVADVRTTKEWKAAEFIPGIYLVDTPGLSANEKDNSTAFEAYKNANFVVFVHTPKVGELHKEEIASINAIADNFSSREFFWKHFCMVYTFREDINDDELKEIQKKINEDISEQCGGKDFPVFCVSNFRYLKGKKSNQSEFVKKSGITEVRNFLLNRCEELKQEKASFYEARLQKLKNEAIDKLNKRKIELKKELEKRKLVYERERDEKVEFIKDINNQLNEYQIKKEQLNTKKKELERLVSELANLKEKHRQEKF